MPTSRKELFAAVLLSVLLLLLAILYAPVFADIAVICWRSEDYSHGLILPFVSAYIIYEKRAALSRVFSSSVSTRSGFAGGLALALFGTLLLFVGEASSSLFAKWISFFPLALGSLALAFGSSAAGALFGPVMLIFMAKPLPDSLVPKLFGPFQTFAAHVSASTLDSLGVPVHLLGNIIEIPGMRLMVEEACSGMRSLMALLTVALIVLQLINLRLAVKVFMVMLAIMTALVLNVFRVTITGILAYFYDPKSATGFFHTFSGMIVFFIGLAILYMAGRIFARFQPKGADA